MRASSAYGTQLAGRCDRKPVLGDSYPGDETSMGEGTAMLHQDVALQLGWIGLGNIWQSKGIDWMILGESESVRRRKRAYPLFSICMVESSDAGTRRREVTCRPWGKIIGWHSED